MRTRDLPIVAAALYEKMGKDGYSKNVIGTAKWIIGIFNNYCIGRNISEVTVSAASEFIREHFGFDYYNTTIPMHTVVRRPLLILFEFEESGTYYKTHQHGSTTEIPAAYEGLFREYRNTVNAMKLVVESKKRKLWVFTKHFEYLEGHQILQTSDIRQSDVYGYINTLMHSPSTIRTIKGIIREIYDWMYGEKHIAFSGRQLFPLIKKNTRNKLLSYYSKAEIQQLLSCIDTSTKSGKYAYCVICLLSYLGMRVGDVINLKFSDIDWNNGMLHYTQQKTQNSQTLPLLDEVKYSLIDYIKNARNETADSEYIFVTTYAPYTKLNCTSSVFRMVTKCMQTAGIEFEGRHHGPHSLRHSLATNLMSENVPISAISNILGHSSTRTTEIYLTVDETHLKEISLEVPHV